MRKENCLRLAFEGCRSLLMFQLSTDLPSPLSWSVPTLASAITATILMVTTLYCRRKRSRRKTNEIGLYLSGRVPCNFNAETSMTG